MLLRFIISLACWSSKNSLTAIWAASTFLSLIQIFCWCLFRFRISFFYFFEDLSFLIKDILEDFCFWFFINFNIPFCKIYFWFVGFFSLFWFFENNINYKSSKNITSNISAIIRNFLVIVFLSIKNKLVYIKLKFILFELKNICLHIFTIEILIFFVHR